MCVCVNVCPYLKLLSHLHEGAGGVEGPRTAGEQVGAVVVVQDLHVVHTINLGDKHKHTIKYNIETHV